MKFINSSTDKNFNKMEFWNDKIIDWENNRYTERYSSIINRSVRNRMLIAASMLKQYSKDLVIVEVGCGTARLMPFFIDLGVRKYVGIDFSRYAIEVARERAKKLEYPFKIDLIQADVTNFKKINADLCFSLGLLDWLTDQGIRSLMKNIKAHYYLHSFSEKTNNIQQLLHRIYVYLKYGYKTKTYMPRYFKREEIDAIFAQCEYKQPKYFVDSEMSFSCFAYNLPVEYNESKHKSIF